MDEVKVNLGKRSYDIKIARGLLDKIGSEVRCLSKADKVAVITDANVDALYGEALQSALEAEGFYVCRIVMEPGEKSKNLETLGQVYAKMAAFGMTRSDLVITFGGGVPGDLGGFAAATFLRGIDFIQVPTSLLAQIDSSVGGKVAIDLPAGKNLVGSFYQPLAVFIDPELLSSLPQRYLHDGLAEAIKYGCIRSSSLFDKLQKIENDEKLLFDIESIIKECCAIKARIVEMDEFDTGERMLLNFGHTIGHAVEKYYNYDTYTHGEGVGIGMLALTEQTEKLGITEKGSAALIRKILEQYGLPTEAVMAKDEVLQTIALDKKKAAGFITLVVLEKIGEARLLKIPCEELTAYIR
ncbi:MAG: 3-dehydroquinate synthase [Acidaminococcaceae bacterium]